MRPVDDDPTVLECLGVLIEHGGHLVDTATSPADALQRIGKRKYDLVFSDVQMPEMNGEQLMREIKARQPYLPVILVSGRRTPLSTKFLAKPFSLRELWRAIALAK